MKILLIGTLLITGCGVQEAVIPPSLTTSDWSRMAPRSEVQPTLVPQATPEPVTNILIVNKSISSKWGLNKALKAWKSVRTSEFKLVKSCAIDLYTPCVTISETNKISRKLAGQTWFGNFPNEMEIQLSHRVRQRNEAENTLAHELGHVLGLPHTGDQENSVMTPESIRRTSPSSLDISTANSLGIWEFEKMYQSSGQLNKLVVRRTAPNGPPDNLGHVSPRETSHPNYTGGQAV